MSERYSMITGDPLDSPAGFFTYTGNAGVKDGTPDISIVASDRPCSAAGVFTRSLFAGPSVSLSRRNLASGTARAVVTVSKNANVANGRQGDADAAELASLAAAAVGCDEGDVLVGSTGVIGRPYPMDKLRAHFRGLDVQERADFGAVARAIMTTDTRPKLASARVGSATVTGIAKGSGMVQPDMATLLAYLFTDAAVPVEELRPLFGEAVDRTFNCLSIDTDTSTSDTALVLANGAAGPLPRGLLANALHDVCHSLTVQLASDGEGATKLIQVAVRGARDESQARRVGKAVVNSPLVKCAVHGADPNWGRVVMAIGKCWQDDGIDPESVTVSFGELEVYPRRVGDGELDKLSGIMSAATVEINIALATGGAAATVWGCDLSPEYVHINADYTT